LLGNLGGALVIFGSPLAFIVSLAALKLCTQRKWAVLGVIIGGIETLIIFIMFMCVLLFAK
jgi:short subunit fatty acids transporter